MSASHKPTIGLSPETGNVYLGRQSKSMPGTWVGEKTDVTGLFMGILLAKFGPESTEESKQTILASSIPGAPSFVVVVHRVEASE